MIKPQREFPLLERYKKHLPNIDGNTIFAYDGVIYSDYALPEHLVIHEKTHLKQQNDIGLDNWVDSFLLSPEFRLKQEIEAYKNQVASIKDRNARNRLRLQCAEHLSSKLYGNIININEAFKAIG